MIPVRKVDLLQEEWVQDWRHWNGSCEKGGAQYYRTWYNCDSVHSVLLISLLGTGLEALELFL